MRSVPQILACGALLAMTTALSDQADAMPVVSSFQFVGSLQVTPGAGVSPAAITFNSDLSILSQNGLPAGDMVGLTGGIGGSYEFSDPLGANTIALVSSSGPNTFSIDDGANVFTANVDLFELMGGGGGSIFGAIDFSSSSYAGSNTSLLALHSSIQNTPDLTVTFQTLGGFGVNLDDLFATGSNGVATFSGVVDVNMDSTPIPEPAPLALLGLGLLCSAAYASRRRSAAIG